MKGPRCHGVSGSELVNFQIYNASTELITATIRTIEYCHGARFSSGRELSFNEVLQPHLRALQADDLFVRDRPWQDLLTDRTLAAVKEKVATGGGKMPTRALLKSLVSNPETWSPARGGLMITVDPDNSPGYDGPSVSITVLWSELQAVLAPQSRRLIESIDMMPGRIEGQGSITYSQVVPAALPSSLPVSAFGRLIIDQAPVPAGQTGFSIVRRSGAAPANPAAGTYVDDTVFQPLKDGSFLLAGTTRGAYNSGEPYKRLGTWMLGISRSFEKEWTRAALYDPRVPNPAFMAESAAGGYWTGGNGQLKPSGAGTGATQARGNQTGDYVYLQKLNPAGDVLWTRPVANPYDSPRVYCGVEANNGLYLASLCKPRRCPMGARTLFRFRGWKSSTRRAKCCGKKPSWKTAIT